MRKLICLLLMICLFGCSKKQKLSNEAKSILQINVDIPIDIKVLRENSDDPEGKYVHFYISKEDDNEIFIDPSSQYYDQYISGKNFSISEEAYVNEGTEFCEFLTMEYYIVNNTTNSLNINGLDIVVEKSEIDRFPYLYLATEAAHSNTLALVNESWYNWKNATLKYKILKKGQTFDGNYDKEKRIEYFEDIKRIDFLPDLIEKGYDYDAVVNAQRDDEYGHDNNYIYLDINNDNFSDFENLFDPFEIGIDHFKDYYGFVRIEGELSFPENDLKVPFSGKIQLSTSAGFGGALDINDEFDIQLQTEGQNYVKHFPYITTIEAGGSERVKLTFKSSKSSNHILTLKAINDNGLTIESKKIYFHFLQPKHSERAKF